jgi:phosphoglycolate phosphatase
MFRHKELILFDFDGTLIDSVPDLSRSINHMLESLGRPVFEEARVRSWVGNGARTLVERALHASYGDHEPPAPALIDDALDTFLNFYAENLSVDTVTYPNVPQVLQRLRDEGYRLAIVTNKPAAFIEPILQTMGMDTLFELKIGGDSLPHKKPDPLPLLHVCATLGIDREKCVMVGDSKNDILAAKAAQMHCIGLGYGYNYDEDIAAYGPDLVLDDFCALGEPFGVSCERA